MTRIHVPIHLRWGDFDAYQHVNNAEMLHLLEEARIQTFWRPDVHDPEAPPTAVLDARPGAAIVSLIARQEVEYLLPIPYQRRPLDVELWIGRIGGASLEIGYEVFSPAASDAEAGAPEPRVLYTRAATTLVMVELASGRPQRIPDEYREAWAPFVEAPIEFARR